jgi:hypothetical protein
VLFHNLFVEKDENASSLFVLRYVGLISSLVLLCFSLNSKAQESIGLSQSNYLPSMSSQLNPALAADAKTRVDITLAGASLFVFNEHSYFASEDKGLVSALFGGASSPVQDLDTHPRDGYLDASIDGPGAFVVLGRTSLGLSTRYKVWFNGEGVPHELAQFIYHGFRHSPLYDSTLHIKDLNVSALTGGEVDLTIAHMLQVTDDHHLNVGLTVKRLFGQNHLGVDIQQMDYTFTSHDLIVENFTGGYSLGTDDVGSGNGWAVDLGVMYRKTIDGRSDYVPYSIDNRCVKSAYQYQIGASIVDLGQVDFKQNSAQVSLTDASAFWPDYIDTEISDVDELDDFLLATFETDQNRSERTLGASVALPTALNVHFDYNFNKGLHLAAVFQHPLKSQRAYSLRRAAIFGVIPRYESRRLEVSLPVSTYEYERVQVGLSLRFLGLTLGSDDLGVLLTDGDQYGMDFYAGLHIPLTERAACSAGKRSRKHLIAPCWGQ